MSDENKEMWILSPGKERDDICSVKFSPELEDHVKEIMIEMFGVQYLQGERTELPDGLIQIKFKGDPEDIRILEEALKRVYAEEHIPKNNN